MEHKFKAWHKKLKRFVQPSKYSCLTEYDTGDNMVASIDTEDIIHMQFTGRHDKDGIEIYEGNIFEVTDGDEWVVGHELAKMDADTLPIDEQCVGKILGNIYENPELMEGEEPCQPPL